MTLNVNTLATKGDHAKTLDFSKASAIQSGQRIDFSKEHPSVTDIRVELHWDSEHDADATIMLLGSDGKALKGLLDASNPNSTKGMVWYHNLTTSGVEHTGDARESDGDPSSPEETIKVQLQNLDPEAESIVIVASTFPTDDAGTGPAVPFGLVKNCRVDIIDNQTNNVLYVYELDEDFSEHTSVELANFYKRDGAWRLTSMGTPVGKSAQALSDIANKYGLV